MSFFALMDNGLVTVWAVALKFLQMVPGETGSVTGSGQGSSAAIHSEEESWEKGSVRGALGKAEAGS